MKIFLRNILFLTPIFIMLVTVNYIGDPAHIFRKGAYEKGIVNLLLAGNNVANISNYDERLLQQDYIAGLTQDFDIIVLGSSRSMLVNSKLFPKKNTNQFRGFWRKHRG